MENTKLIKGCKEADSKAQRQLLDKFSGLLLSVALRYSRDRSEAKDILQESWINIFKGILKYNHEGKLEGWMSRIVINVALRKKQNFHSRSAVYDGTFYEDVSELPEALSQLQYDDLLRIVNQLPDGCREVFKMASIDGLKHKEIGEMLGIEESTSRAHLTRAKKKLRDILAQLEKVETYGE
ncbi:MAG: RNA polymerase sigma-70 factor (ECF subfamily) [Saprospiraceae bacterium]|jgi:RNA polymerase sigma-70 factor (ECF subfamily)|tara:strand:+ start:4324 stop:4869 length:546 start_codon:yes stop_codon:yes gene_type:complete